MDHNPRLVRALELIQQAELDGLIVYSNGTSHILRPAYFHYISGLRPLGRNNAVIISKDGRASLLVESPWDAARAAAKSWIGDVRGSLSFSENMAGIIRDFGMQGNIGVAGLPEMTAPVYNTISGLAAVSPADHIIEEIARVKTPEEIDKVRQAARLADLGFQAVLEKTRHGITEYELAAEAGYAMRAAGADDIFMLLSTERHNYALHTPLEKPISHGDIVIFEMAPFCDGQCVQVCRTIVVGSPSPVLSEKYALLLQSFEESLQQIKPGLPASLMSKAMNRIIGAAGYAEYCKPPHMRARGHGFGVGSIAPGAVIDDDNDVLLERHQVLVPHPNQYFLETGYLACGETVMVTDSGFERLMTTETRLYVKED